MKAILSADINWGIGCDGNLLARVPEDMKFFKEKTLGKVVVMGRKTYESLPNKAPLPERTNIVLTKNKEFTDDRIIILHSVDAVFEETKGYNDEDVFIIGGQEIYNLFLPYCDDVYVTKFQKEFVADKFFPDLDRDTSWEVWDAGEEKEYKGLKYKFMLYKNKMLEVKK